MKLSGSPRDEPEVGLTALIDVVFLLLIFFMVSTTFERESSLAIQLPEASQLPAPARDPGIELSIDAGGRFAVNGQPLVNPSVETLTRALEDAARAAPAKENGTQVTISADESTPHRAVVRALDAARRAGLPRLAFAARFDADGDGDGEAASD